MQYRYCTLVCSLPVGFNHTCNFPGQVDNINRWAQVNLMSLNLAKTKELVIKTRTSKPTPDTVNGIKQVLSFDCLPSSTASLLTSVSAAVTG